MKEEEWVKVRQQNPKQEAKKPEWLRCARPKAVLMKLAEEVSYAAILKDLKKRVKPEKLGVIVQGIREISSKDLLAGLECSKENRGRLNFVFKEVVGASGSVRHLISRVEVDCGDCTENELGRLLARDSGITLPECACI